MKHALTTLLAVCAVVGSGCMMSNTTPGEKLRDAVMGYNEACRWSRFDIAIEQVDGPARESFQRDHGRWGRSIAIADLEVVSVSAAGHADDARAVSVVTNHWYTNDATYLHSTTLRQEWRKERTNFFLTHEEVVDGDRGLFEPLPGVAPATAPASAPPSPGDASAADTTTTAASAPTTDAQTTAAPSR